MTRLRSSIHLRIVPLCAVTFLLALVTTQAAHALPNSVISELQQTESTDHNLFGVAVDADGNRAVIGSMAPDYRDAPSSVYLYDFANPESMMSLRILSPAAKPGLLGSVGQSIALSGSRLFVGAPNEGNRGVVYMFDISDLSNITYRTIVPFDVADYTSFGWSLAISGNRLVV